MRLGKFQGYYWLVSSEALWSLHKLVIQYHRGCKLAITSFDSGQITPSEEELKLGWVVKNDLMVSPKITCEIEIPHDQYDEWYIAKELELSASRLEVFVNYGGFSLIPPQESYSEFDPSWGRGALDFLIPMQERFWDQLLCVKPETYVAIGDKDIVVSRNEIFIKHVQKAHSQ